MEEDCSNDIMAGTGSRGDSKEPAFVRRVDVEQVDPPLAVPKRSDGFLWSKPPEMEYKCLSASARLAHAVAMETRARQQEVILRLVCRQFKKANRERVLLLQELEGYRGHARDDLYRENIILRERIDRVTRENLKLRGLQMKDRMQASRTKRANTR